MTNGLPGESAWDVIGFKKPVWMCRREGGLWIICSGQSRLRSFPSSFLPERPPFRPLPVFPNHSTHAEQTCTLCIKVHIVEMYTHTCIYMRIWCPVWCVSMAKPVGPSHPLDSTETELDCLRTVDTCNNSTISTQLSLSPSPDLQGLPPMLWE